MARAAAAAGMGADRSPFALDDVEAYRRWRDWKLARAPRRVEDLMVAVGDAARLSAAETAAIASRCRSANMAIYVGVDRGDDKSIVSRLGARFGLVSLDANWLADEDGISRITCREEGPGQDFIPYTDRPIRWHTDGYYNPPAQAIRGMILHCVRPARRGGENALMDPEIAYILLRDESPELVAALMAPTAMTIPSRTDAEGIARAAQAGPVFSVDAASGDLHMRYTARTRSIEWRDDATTRAAAGRLQALLDGGGEHVYRVRLEAGMGLVCNNVLHDRSGFADVADAPPSCRRLLHRARFHERIAQTLGSYRGARAGQEAASGSMRVMN